MGCALQKDPLLGGFGAVQLKILLDIVLENQRPEGFTACEIGSGAGGFTKQVEIASVSSEFFHLPLTVLSTFDL